MINPSTSVSPGCDTHVQGEVPAPSAPRPAGGGPGQRQVAFQAHVLRDGATAQRRGRDLPRRAQVTLEAPLHFAQTQCI